MSKCCASLETAADASRGENKQIQRNARGSPLWGDADILLHVTCILLIMTFTIVQMVSCRGTPQNAGPQAIACLACPIATPLSTRAQSVKPEGNSPIKKENRQISHLLRLLYSSALMLVNSILCNRKIAIFRLLRQPYTQLLIRGDVCCISVVISDYNMPYRL